MTALASTSDLTARLGRALSTEEAARAAALLTDASAAVRLYTGQTFTSVSTTSRVPVRNGRIRLSQRPVTAVDTVKDVEGNTLTVTWLGNQTIVVDAPANAFEINSRRFLLAVADVTYTHGGTIPDAIVGVVSNIVLRALGQKPTDGGMSQENIDGYSYVIGSTGASGPFGLLSDEKETLDHYKRVGGSVSTL